MITSVIDTLKTLHFDCENRPLSYWYDEKSSAEITAIAWSWSDSSKIDWCFLDKEGHMDGFFSFLSAYEESDLVTGHYIRKHDLPLVNAMLIELGLKTLRPKLASDTRLDIPKRLDLPASQEALCAYFGIKAPKVQMTQADWREANRLTEKGIAKTKLRVIGDIKQHKAMRAELIKREMLKAPKLWIP